MLISIDPGANGGIACQDNDGRVWADPMPDGMTEIYNHIRELTLDMDTVRAVMERTGGYMPGNSGPAAATFARHCGHLEMALFALKIPCEQVAPQTWMKSLKLPTNLKNCPLPKIKQIRKNTIKEMMQRLYPHLKVTLKTSDALGLLTYYIQKAR